MHALFEGGLRRGELRNLSQPANLLHSGFPADIRQALDGEVAATAQPGAQTEQRSHEDRLGEMAGELPDALVARLPCLVQAQGLLAAQVQREVGALHVSVGFELGHDFGGDGRITADTTVKADPGSLFLELDAAAPRARVGFVKGHGLFSDVEEGEPCPRNRGRRVPRWVDAWRSVERDAAWRWQRASQWLAPGVEQPAH